jgi:alkanesulfonate monooxygenase SsuD/methylene tetrahydromethanopterin reductase-like flavin-dependent oxidoreductase (luciferase family)
MRFAVYLANFGTYADPSVVVRIARAAASAGWDGLFLWDHLAFVWNGPSADPWTTLAAVAASTEGLTLGTALTPLPRRRPQIVAQQVQTVERLNGGNVVLGAGLGGNRREFEAFGEDFDEHRRARALDERLELVRSLWPGPIWIGGNSDKALQRAARWDGWIPNTVDPAGRTMTPPKLAERLECIAPAAGFEVAAAGYSHGPDSETPRAYADAGATWWLENFHDRRGNLDLTLARVEAGPDGPDKTRVS